MVRNVGIRVALRLVASLIQLATFALLARDLGPEAFVVFATIIAITAAASSVVTIGLPTAALRIQGQDHPRGAAFSILVFLLIVYVILSITVGSISYLSAVPTVIVIATSIAIFSDGANDAVQWTLTGLERHAFAGWLMVARRTFTLAVAIVFTASGAPTIEGFAVGCAISLTVPLALLVKWRTEPILASIVRKLGIRYWPQNMLNATWSLDVPIAASVLDATDAASYAAGSRFAAPLSLVVQSVVAIATPRLIALDQRRDRLAIWRRLRLAAIGYSLVLAASSPLIAYFALALLGPDYRSARLVVIAVCFASSISVMSQVYISWELAQGFARSINVATFCGIGIGLGSLALLGGTTGILGAALTPILTQTMILVILVHLSDVRNGTDPDVDPAYS